MLKNTRKISSSYLNCLTHYGSLTAHRYEMWDLSQSSIYQNTHIHPKQHMALPNICSWLFLFSATNKLVQFTFPEEVVNRIFQQYICSTSTKVAADKSCSKTNVWQEVKVQNYTIHNDTHNAQACVLNIDLNGLGSHGAATVGPSHLQRTHSNNVHLIPHGARSYLILIIERFRAQRQKFDGQSGKGQLSVSGLYFSPISIIPQKLHIHLVK